MEESYYVKGFVLKRIPFRERDSKILLITELKGILDLVVRGTINPKSKLVNHIEPLSFVEVMVVKGKNFDYVGSLRALEAFQGIKAEYDSSYWSQKSISSLLKSTYRNQGDESLFFLVAEYLDHIDNNKIDTEFFHYVFVFRMLSQLGYHPELYYCVESGHKIDQEKIFFDYQKGGLTKKRTKTSLTITVDCLKVLRFILNSDFGSINKLKINKKIKDLSVNTISLFNQFHNI